MEKRNIPFLIPDISDAEIRETADALGSGWITTGPKTKKLEKEIAEWVGTKKCVCLNSQTACAETALRILGIGELHGGSAEDEVITCAYTYTASASVIAHVGGRIRLVDCSPKTGSIEMDYDALEAAINEHTKAIIPVDLGGIPCDYARIYDIVERKAGLFKPSTDIQKALGRVAVMADAAHAFGAGYKGTMIGAVADFTSFSFHAVKNFTTAEGGALCWRSIPGISDDEIYKLAQLYSLHGQSKDALAKEKLGSWEYDVLMLGYKCNMTDIAAALGLAQFERYPVMLEKRRELIARYDAAFAAAGFPIEVLDHYNDEHISSGHLYLTRAFKKDGTAFSDEERREVIVKMAERGICCNVHYKPLPLLTAYKNLGFDIADYPNAYAKYQNGISLPLYTKLSTEDVDYVIENFLDILREYA